MSLTLTWSWDKLRNSGLQEATVADIITKLPEMFDTKLTPQLASISKHHPDTTWVVEVSIELKKDWYVGKLHFKCPWEDHYVRIDENEANHDLWPMCADLVKKLKQEIEHDKR